MMTVEEVVTQVGDLLKKHNSILSAENQGLERLKPVLKSLYWLICSSLSCEVDDPGISAAENGSKLNFKDTASLSSLLFGALPDRSSLGAFLMSMDQDSGQALLHAHQRDSVQVLLLLLRCCFLMVRLHPHDQSVIKGFLDAIDDEGLSPFRDSVTGMERGSSISTRVICSWSICGSGTTSFYDHFSVKRSDSFRLLPKRMLEVYLDEMVVDRRLQSCIPMSILSSTTEGSHFRCSSIHTESVLDVIAAHFLISVSGEQALQTFAQSLIWTQKQMLLFPELSLTAAISLVKHPVLSSDKLLQAHLISLVSEVIGINALSKMVPNIRCLELYLSAFYDSASLYSGHLSKLLSDSTSSPLKQEKPVRTPFEPRLHSEIKGKVRSMLDDWNISWSARINDMCANTPFGVANDAISYIEANLNVIYESNKANLNVIYESNSDKIYRFLRSLVRMIPDKVNEVLLTRIREMALQDLCLLASVLKLMSCSLLQAFCCLKEKSSCSKLSSKKTPADFGWRSLVGVMSCFGQSNLDLPIGIKHLIIDYLKPHHSAHDDIGTILSHFAGLLLLCTATGLDFLVRGCLFMMMVFMNMLPSENDPLPVTNSGHEVCRSGKGKCPLDNAQVAPNPKLISRFLRMRQQSLRGCTRTKSGVPYLKNILDNRDDIDDLADFVECKVGKDYSAFVKIKAKTRYRKCLKKAMKVKEKKMMVYDLLRSQRNRNTLRELLPKNRQFL